MTTIKRLLLPVLATVLAAGCALPTPAPKELEGPATRAEQQEAQRVMQESQEKTYKRKIAVGRFTNESRYGKTLLRDEDLDPLGKQATDILMSRLVDTQKFIVLERPDLVKVEREQALTGIFNLVGSDVLIIGSVTEFGRSNVGKVGFMSSTKKQVATAKVDIRLVDVRNGHVFFSATGSGQADSETGEIAGYGSRSGYDATLNDRAIAAAVSDVLGEIVARLEQRSWRADILKVKDGKVYISAGKRQGLKVGDELSVMREGEPVKNPGTGFMITLPSEPLGTVRVVSQFGDSEINEGSVCVVVDGTFMAGNIKGLFVSEKQEAD